MIQDDVTHAIDTYVEERPHLFIACETPRERTWVRKLLEYEAMALEFPEFHSMYVYKADDLRRWRTIPTLKKARLIPDLEPMLMEHYGRGKYRVLIKRGRPVVYKQILYIGIGSA